MKKKITEEDIRRIRRKHIPHRGGGGQHKHKNEPKSGRNNEKQDIKKDLKETQE